MRRKGGGELRTSQYIAPASPLRTAYCALVLAMLGVSNEMNCFFVASKDHDETLVMFSNLRAERW